MQNKYVAGFVFDLFGDRVILIKKLKPCWQLNFFNAVGGKIEIGETPLQSMIRECKEEIDLDITTWGNFAELKGVEPTRYPISGNPEAGNSWSVEWFYSFTTKIGNFHNNTKEIAEIFNVKLLPENTLNNIPWLIQMALRHEADRADKFIVQEVNY